MPDVALHVLDESTESERRRQDLARRLDALIEGEVRFGRHDRMLYATDASFYQVAPIGVVNPKTIEDVRHTAAFCFEHKLPILPRGGGTSLAGQAVNHAVVIDMSRHLNALLDIDPTARVARVQPGIVLDHLNEALAPFGLMFGPDVATSSHANIGGMIGNNSSGAHSVLYGRTVEHLRGIEALLADGATHSFRAGAAVAGTNQHHLVQSLAAIIQPIREQIRQRYPRTLRHVDGYNLDLLLDQVEASNGDDFDQVNLAHLLCGSEGTLAVTLEAELNLVERPACRGLAIIAFDGVDEALRTVAPILQTNPAAVELIDNVVIDLARRNAVHRHHVELLPRMPCGAIGAVLYVEYFAGSEAELGDSLANVTKTFGTERVHTYTQPSAMRQAWALRKAGEPLLYGMPGNRKPLTFIEDTAVDPEHLVAFVAEFRDLLAQHGTTAAYYAHASVGCLHIRPMIDLRNDSDRQAMLAIATEATALVKRYGGALSGEHGDGRLRSHLLEAFYGGDICEAFRQIKQVFDPQWLLNPGNMIDPPAMDSHLRVKPNTVFTAYPEVETYFRYEREHGFAGAVEMCNGAGVCRRMSGGTMCPSYRATRDERHATRGRGNALRLAITGQLISDADQRWNDAETLQTLDLCLSCKACKSECPSNVDIAKLKAEYLAQGFKRYGMPLSTRLFANIRTLNRVGAMLPGVSNRLVESRMGRRLAQRLLKIDARRSLPRFERSLFHWFKRQTSVKLTADAPTVLLFADCFTAYNEPRIGRAAVGVLEALGYRVLLPDVGCCGRAAISQGALNIAQDISEATARALLDVIDRENPIAILGCEPSCISAIIDDWPDLKFPNLKSQNLKFQSSKSSDVKSSNLKSQISDADVRRLAAMTQAVEDFIEKQWDQHPQAPGFREQEPGVVVPRVVGPGVVAHDAVQRVLIHGHCHQKALWDVGTTAALLRRTGASVDIIDSGCCGMAGSFGYDADHFDLSMQIGELSLFPAVRAEPNAIIIAPGTSCRHQLRDGAHRTALHPIEFIAKRYS